MDSLLNTPGGIAGIAVSSSMAGLLLLIFFIAIISVAIYYAVGYIRKKESPSMINF